MLITFDMHYSLNKHNTKLLYHLRKPRVLSPLRSLHVRNEVVLLRSLHVRNEVDLVPLACKDAALFYHLRKPRVLSLRRSLRVRNDVDLVPLACEDAALFSRGAKVKPFSEWSLQMLSWYIK